MKAKFKMGKTRVREIYKRPLQDDNDIYCDSNDTNTRRRIALTKKKKKNYSTNLEGKHLQFGGKSNTELGNRREKEN